jgi:hypothetical protein
MQLPHMQIVRDSCKLLHVRLYLVWQKALQPGLQPAAQLPVLSTPSATLLTQQQRLLLCVTHVLIQQSALGVVRTLFCC